MRKEAHASGEDRTQGDCALNVLESACVSKHGLRVDQERGLEFREQPGTREQMQETRSRKTRYQGLKGRCGRQEESDPNVLRSDRHTFVMQTGRDTSEKENGRRLKGWEST